MNIAILGAGGIALKLHLPQLAELPDVHVTHLAGRKPERLRILAERFDIPHWTTDYDAIFSDPSIEGVVIAVPHPLHVSFGLKALAAGKHVLMQKPLCGDMQEARDFVAAVERSDRTVMCLPHFGPDIYACRRLIREGAIGKLSSAYCRVSHGGPEVYYAEIRDNFGESGDDLWFFKADQASVGALFDMGVYAVAALVAVMGPAKSVLGHVTTVDKPTSLEDTAALLIEFANGAIGTAETGWCDPARTWKLSVHGTRGKLEAPGHHSASLTRWEPGSYTREDEPAVPHTIDLPEEEAGDLHGLWLRCIRQHRQPAVSNAHFACHVTEILLAGLESSRTGQRISLTTSL